MVKHTQVPINGTTKLKPIDWYIYACIKKYMNKDTQIAFPSIQTICNDTDCDKRKINNTIKKLIHHKKLIVTKIIGKSNQYYFPKIEEKFEMFTDEFLENKNLDNKQKAFLMGVQSLSFKEDGFMCSSKSNYQIANELNISERTVDMYIVQLKEQNIMHEIQLKSQEEGGFLKRMRTVDLALVCQATLFVNDKTDHNIRETDLLREENLYLKKQLSQLSKQYAELTKPQQSFKM